MIDNAINAVQVENISVRTKRNAVLIGLLIVQSLTTMAGVDGLSEHDRADIVAFLGSFRLIAKTLEKNLGWENPHPKKK